MIRQFFLHSRLQALPDAEFISAEGEQTRAGLRKDVALDTSAQFKISIIYNSYIDYEKGTLRVMHKNTD